MTLFRETDQILNILIELSKFLFFCLKEKRSDLLTKDNIFFR